MKFHSGGGESPQKAGFQEELRACAERRSQDSLTPWVDRTHWGVLPMQYSFSESKDVCSYNQTIGQ